MAVLFTGTIGLLFCGIVISTRLPLRVKQIVCLGVLLRYVGAYARQSMAADAHVYFDWGMRYAECFARLDFSPIFDRELWRSAQWIGTNFMGYPPGLVMTFVGPSWLGTFFAFGLISFTGLVAYAVAFRRSFPGVRYLGYWAWVFLLPSLWFWPSSIGKESLMLVGLGVATLGFAGRNGRENWLVLALGVVLVFCIRPEVAAVFLLALILSYWLRFEAWTAKRAVQGLFVLAVGLPGIWFAMDTTLEGEVGLAEVEQYIDENASRNEDGGSSIEGVGASLAGIPLAVVNVLFRPFIWEAHNLTALVSAVEVLAIWGIVWYRRRELCAALAMWRRHRMLRLAVPFTALYVVALGMNLSNLGLVARQRVLVYPLLFLIVEAGMYFRRPPQRRWAHAKARRIHARTRPLQRIAVPQ